jgi:hypothetical protein
MHPPDVFLIRAAECERMAACTPDLGIKATWKGMAERWHRCAVLATSSAAGNVDGNRHRKPVPGWARH